MRAAYMTVAMVDESGIAQACIRGSPIVMRTTSLIPPVNSTEGVEWFSAAALIGRFWTLDV